METGTFKSVAFGGFDKEDVVRYIEQSAREAAARQEELQKEADSLRKEAEALRARVQELEEELRVQADSRDEAITRLERERSEREALEGARQEAEQLRAQIEKLQPEAEAYEQFRDRLGQIECEAHRRAAELEETTSAQLRRSVEQFRARYHEVAGALETACAHVTAELRNVDVRLTQLPRAMDQTAAELKELSALLEKTGRKEEKERP